MKALRKIINSNSFVFSGEFITGICFGVPALFLFIFLSPSLPEELISFVATFSITFSGFLFTAYSILITNKSIVKNIQNKRIKGRTFGVIICAIIEFLISAVLIGIYYFCEFYFLFSISISLLVAGVVTSVFVIRWLYMLVDGID